MLQATRETFDAYAEPSSESDGHDEVIDLQVSEQPVRSRNMPFHLVSFHSAQGSVQHGLMQGSQARPSQCLLTGARPLHEQGSKSKIASPAHPTNLFAAAV